MKYTIVWKEQEQSYEMSGVFSESIGDHLKSIAKAEGFIITPGNASELEEVLRSLGVEITVVKENGEGIYGSIKV